MSINLNPHNYAVAAPGEDGVGTVVSICDGDDERITALLDWRQALALAEGLLTLAREDRMREERFRN